MAKKTSDLKTHLAPNQVTFQNPIRSKVEDKSGANSSSPIGDGKDNSNLYFGIGVLLIVLILAVVFALNAFHNSSNTPDTSLLTPVPDVTSFEYNNYSFNYYEGKWHTSLFAQDGRVFDVPLKFSPRDLDFVEVNGNYNEEFGKGGVYITFDPNSKIPNFSFLGLSAAELTLSLTGVLNIPVTGACTTHDTDATECLEKPIITCNSNNVSVILLKDSDIVIPSVTYIDNCIVLEGKSFDLLKSVDRLLYSWFNILPYSNTNSAENNTLSLTNFS